MLEPDTDVMNKAMDYYSPSHDHSIRYDDPTVWPFEKRSLQLSPRRASSR
jgi:dTDP-4-dehydrorhamnose 3,5-epimerase